MITESNLDSALTWVTESDRTEFNYCIGQYNLHLQGIGDFNLSDFRPIIIVLFFLYNAECEDY
jgi:hypothetical protein